MPCYKVWDGEKAIWYYEMQLKKVVELIDVLRYGDVLTEDHIHCFPNGKAGWVSIRTIRYESAIYYMNIVNSEVVEFKELTV